MPDENLVQNWWNQPSATGSNQADDFDLSFWDWDFAASESSAATNQPTSESAWGNAASPENNSSTGDSQANNDTASDSSDDFDISMWDIGGDSSTDENTNSAPTNNNPTDNSAMNNNTANNNATNNNATNNAIATKQINLSEANNNSTSIDVDWSSNFELDLEFPKDHSNQKYVINIHFK